MSFIKSLEEEVSELLKGGLTAEQIAEQVQLDLSIIQDVIQKLNPI